MYKVIKEFYDLMDFTESKSGKIYYKYEVGDYYPREGLNPNETRIKELCGKDNKQGQPLIKALNKPSK